MCFYNSLSKSQPHYPQLQIQMYSSKRSRSFNIDPDAAYIVAYNRTPFGSYGGGLASFSAIQLGTIAVKAALENYHIPSQSVDEVIFGCVLQANLGQAPARQVALNAGLPLSTPCTTINKVCSSGMKGTVHFFIY